MCGRFAINDEVDELIREYVAAGGRLRDWKGVYSVAPTQRAPIVRDEVDDDGRVQRGLELARWDWEKPPSMPASRPLINARIEKLAAGMWVGAFSNARCIVPMTGYYEWTTEGKVKTPHFVHGDGLLSAAGLTWHMNHDGEQVRCFVVITRKARDAAGRVHDRMPAFLTPDMRDRWLDTTSLTVKGNTVASKANREAFVADLLTASDQVASTIQEHEVDRRVSNTRTVDQYDRTLIEPVSE